MNHSKTCGVSRSATSLNTAVMLTCIFLADSLFAQTTGESGWQRKAEEHLRAIYERGEFRAKNYRPTWLKDSSGFVIDEVDSITKQPVRWFHDVQTGERRVLKADERLVESTDPTDSPNGKRRLIIRDAKLMAVDLESQNETLLVSGLPDHEVFYRNLAWSPDSTRVAFVEVDTTNVRQRAVLVPGDPSYPDVEQHRFARVGEAIEKLRIGIANSDGRELRWLPIESPEEGFYLGQVEWAGNSEELLVEWFSRFRDKRKFILFSSNDDAKSIYTEESDAWAESSQGKNSGLVWIGNGKSFVVISEQDGWRHAYLYARDGKKVACLTPGDYDIIDRAVIDEKHGWYYFYASPLNATQKYLYRVPLDGSGKSERITPDDQTGTHSYLFSPDAQFSVHTRSTLDTPPLHELIEVEGHRVVCTLESHRELREKMRSLIAQPTEFLKLDVGDGIVLDAWMLKPRNFNNSKKYPLLIYVYGEPHAQTVLDEWGTSHIDFHRLIAELGFVVVSMDNRGTPAPKGAAWRRSIFGSLGPLSTEEQAAGLKALAKQYSFIDMDRVGIWGWSGGGSNTLNALFRKPDLYHVGIAVVPKPQPHLYNAWFQEIYMRTRESNPEGYERSAPIHFAQGLEGKLLIMTGSGETNTHIQIIEGLVDRLIALGKPFDYMVYPNRDHGLREGAGTSVHVRMHILRYLIDNLSARPN